MRPRIAIPADTLTEATNIINERNAAFAPRPLIEAIVKSGGLPVILPSIDPALAADYRDLFDGIIFAGGADVDPTFFGEEPHQALGPTYRKRDLFEIALLKEAVHAAKAIMGICRGMQLINIALGGSVYQDLSEDPRKTLKHAQAAPATCPPTTSPLKRTAGSSSWSVGAPTLTPVTTRPFTRLRPHSGSRRWPTTRCPRQLSPSPTTAFSPSSGTRRICSSTMIIPNGSLQT